MIGLGYVKWSAEQPEMPEPDTWGQSLAAEGQQMLFKNINIDGLNIFYREAGKETAPKLVLLHGFPAS
ncbi:MAG TPA: alpha/beta hydrolase, partial [Xanthobacteraceae bacterium]|nr:alpha/beta hydrolase [Xanthobacteraceae bacterium]